MIHLILDTNIYKDDPKRKKLPFLAVEKLALAKEVKLHVPYIVEREFQTQQQKHYKDALKGASAELFALTSLSKKTSIKTLKSAPSWLAQIKEDHDAITAEAANEIIGWFNKIDASRIPLDTDQALQAMEAYFSGTPPFKEPKVRKDIPDSFIARAIEKVQAEHGEIHAVIHDKNLRESFTSEQIKTYTTLQEFVEAALVQDALFDLDVLDNFSNVSTAIQAFENETGEIKTYLEKHIGDLIVMKTVHNAPVLDDNREITITSYGDAEDIEIDFDEVSYFGDGQCGVPFSLTVEVLADYYIFKSDYYAHFGDSKGPYVTDHNDHYYEAEDAFNIRVEGLFVISLDKGQIKSEDIASLLNSESLDISEITDLSVIE